MREGERGRYRIETDREYKMSQCVTSVMLMVQEDEVNRTEILFTPILHELHDYDEDDLWFSYSKNSSSSIIILLK